MDFAKKRRSRFIRSSDPPVINVLKSQRALFILKLLEQFQYLTKDQLKVLLNTDGRPTTDWAIRECLLKLFHGGYVQRRFMTVVSGSSPAIYSLDHPGATVLAQQEDRFPDDYSYPKAPSTSKPHRGVPWNYKENLAHNLMISQVLVCLVAGAKRLGIEVVTFLHDTVRLPALRTLHLPVYPDGLVIFADNNQRYSFFLEADRSTTTRSVFRGKLMRYLDWFDKDGHKDLIRFIYQDRLKTTPLCEDWLKHIRVLTVTPTLSRTTGLREIACSLGNGHGAFVFTHQSQFSLEQPEQIWADLIWWVGHPAALKPVSLIPSIQNQKMT